MNRKIMRLGAGILVLANLIANCVTMTAQAEETYVGSLLREEVVLDVSLEQTIEVDELVAEQRIYGAKSYSSIWETYGNYYIYNQLTEEEKAYWDTLNELCLSYLLEEKDMPSTSGVFHTELVGSTVLTGEQMREIMWLFRFSNPQYYFLNHKVYHNAEGTYYGYGVYTAFGSGTNRKQATLALEEQVKEMLSKIALSKSDEEKVKTIHDLILEKVDYNAKIYQAGFNEDVEYSQSVYSVFCGDITVCAGYSQAFAMLCNAVGIDAISVTSLEHEWNKVRINDSWYNVDCTWNDYGTYGIGYLYYERSDAALDEYGLESQRVHTEESFWQEYLPSCTLDVTPQQNGNAPGSLPKITKQTAKPVMEIERDVLTATITITGEERAKFYYTLDGSTPSSAETKCISYQEPFVVTEKVQVTVMAIKDAQWDSATTTETVNPLEPILVERDGNHYYYVNGQMVTSQECYVNGAWRWFDADGTMAKDKDVYQISSGGKWVRYNENGEMVKGEDYKSGSWYYFEPITGAMMKGPVTLSDGRRVFYDTITGKMLTGHQIINGEEYYFDETDGNLIDGKESLFWISVDGREFWYENWQRQGWNPADDTYRGKEIYDPASDAWYWLDNIQHGAKAVSKDVYQESDAGPYADREDGTGKWVRYDEAGHMIKGWHQSENGTYYFDPIYGSMAKRETVIDGIWYYFDEITGVLR